jgi:hypothetical protein
VYNYDWTCPQGGSYVGGGTCHRSDPVYTLGCWSGGDAFTSLWYGAGRCGVMEYIWAWYGDPGMCSWYGQEPDDWGFCRHSVYWAYNAHTGWSTYAYSASWSHVSTSYPTYAATGTWSYTLT